MEGLREERTDDPGIVSKSFRGAFFLSFFFSPPPLSKKKEERSNGEKKHGEKERERESASQSKVSKKYQEAGREELNVDDESKLVDLRRWKNYGQR